MPLYKKQRIEKIKMISKAIMVTYSICEFLH